MSCSSGTASLLATLSRGGLWLGHRARPLLIRVTSPPHTQQPWFPGKNPPGPVPTLGERSQSTAPKGGRGGRVFIKEVTSKPGNL